MGSHGSCDLGGDERPQPWTIWRRASGLAGVLVAGFLLAGCASTGHGVLIGNPGYVIHKRELAFHIPVTVTHSPRGFYATADVEYHAVGGSDWVVVAPGTTHWTKADLPVPSDKNGHKAEGSLHFRPVRCKAGYYRLQISYEGTDYKHQRVKDSITWPSATVNGPYKDGIGISRRACSGK